MSALKFNPSKPRSPDSRAGEHGKPGFTVIELLVVIAVLGLLAVTLGTALATTRPDAQSFQCRNNLRQLGLAWRVYSEDFQGWLVFNRDGANAGLSSDTRSWAGGWLDFTPSSDNTNTDLLINHTRYPYSAHLGPYLKTAAVFKCPADKSVVNMPGGSLPRVRSVSLNNCMGQGSRLWSTPSAYRAYTKANQIGSPANLFVFVDEKEESINDGLFFSDPDHSYQLIDYPASFHSGGGAFSFADGRAETHLWKDPRTCPIVPPGQLIPLNVNVPGDVDIDWLQQHASERR